MAINRYQVLGGRGGFMGPAEARRLVRAGRARFRGETAIELFAALTGRILWTEFSNSGGPARLRPGWLRGVVMNGRAINRAG